MSKSLSLKKTDFALVSFDNKDEKVNSFIEELQVCGFKKIC